MSTTVFFSLFLLSSTLALVFGEKNTEQLCNKIDVSDDPPLEARFESGIWYTQRALTNRRGPINAIYLYQFEGQVKWENLWDSRKRKCTYKKYREKQKQSIKFGPFAPCVTSTEELPTPGNPKEWVYFMPTENVLMKYRCDEEPRKDGSCPVKPEVFVLTRTKLIRPAELDMVERRLEKLGILLGRLVIIIPGSNGCKLPPTAKQTAKQSRRSHYRYR